MNQPELANDPTALPALGDHPLLFRMVLGLFLAGLAVDILMFASFWRRRSTSGAGLRLQIQDKPWGLADVGLVSAAVFTMLFTAFLVVSWMHRLDILSVTEETLAQLLAGAISLNGLGVVAILLLVRVERISLREAFGIGWKQLGHAAARGPVFFLAIIPPLWILMAASEEVCSRFHMSAPQEIAQLFLTTHSATTRWTIVLLAVVGAPVFEELFFRGFAYPALKQKIGFYPALILTSLLFALIHHHVPSFVPLLALAIVLTLAYESTGNLGVPMVMHSLFNLMTIGQMLIVQT